MINQLINFHFQSIDVFVTVILCFSAID